MRLPDIPLVPRGDPLFSNQLLSDALRRRVDDALHEAHRRFGRLVEPSVTRKRAIALSCARVKALTILSSKPWIDSFPDIDPTDGPPRTVFNASLPFSGTVELWRLRPDAVRQVYLRGHAPIIGDDGRVTLSVSVQNGLERAVPPFFEEEFATLKRVLSAQHAQIKRFNVWLRAMIEERVPSKAALRQLHEALEEITF